MIEPSSKAQRASRRGALKLMPPVNRAAGRRPNLDETRGRILDAAEEHFRRIGYHKTSIADIASGVGMSPANVYRYFPSRDAINETICRRILDAVVDIALAIAGAKAPAVDKLKCVLTTVHRHNKMTWVTERHVHDLIVTALQENWPTMKTHLQRMAAIFEEIIRDGVTASEFEVEDTAEAAGAVQLAFMPFFHPILIEHCVQLGEDSEERLGTQIRFILKALGSSAAYEQS